MMIAPNVLLFHLTTFEIPFYINPSMIHADVCCGVVVLLERQPMCSNRFTPILESRGKKKKAEQKETNDVAERVAVC